MYVFFLILIERKCNEFNGLLVLQHSGIIKKDNTLAFDMAAFSRQVLHIVLHKRPFQHKNKTVIFVFTGSVAITHSQSGKLMWRRIVSCFL